MSFAHRLAVVFLFLLPYCSVADTWIQTSGPAGGKIAALDSSDRFLLAGIDGGGLFSSSDSGATWVRLADLPPAARRINQIASVEDWIFAGTADAGVFRSDDDGATWSLAHTGLVGLVVLQFFEREGDLFALVAPDENSAGSGTLHRWNATATSWEPIASSTTLTQFAFIGSALLANFGAGVGLIRSFDGGIGWEFIGGVNADVFAVGSDALYASAGAAKVYRTTDQGDSWTTLSEGFDADLHIAHLHVSGATLLAAPTSDLYRSINAGASWSLAADGLGTGQGRYVQCFASGAGELYLGTNAGVYRGALDAETWNAANTGLTATRVSFLASDGTNVYATAGASFRISEAFDVVFRMPNDGVTWEQSAQGLPPGINLTALTVGSPGPYVGSFSHGVFRSTDGGTTWSVASDGLPTFAGGFSFYETGYLAARDLTVYAALQPRFSQPDHGAGHAQGGGMFRSTDGGSNWSPINTGLPLLGTNNPPFDYLYRPRITGLALLDEGLFIGTERHGIFRSTNNGETWSNVNSGLPLDPSGNPPRMTCFVAFDGAILAGSKGFYLGPVFDASGLFTSLDGGTSWTATGQGLPPNRPVAALGSACRSLYAAVGCSARDGFCQGEPGDGLYRSQDGGQIWWPMVTPLDDVSISSLVLHGDALFAGTLGSGVWRGECQSAPGDLDGDGGLSLLDVHQFFGCVTGPADPSSDSACGAADFDVDGDVDFVDFGRMQLLMGQ